MVTAQPVVSGKVEFADIPTAIRVIRDGGMCVVMDDESRENEGDIIMAAECVTAKQCALTIRHTTGILCAPMIAERAEELELPRMVKKNEDPNGTAFTVTCDSIHTTTGVSAQDRTRTFRDLADSTCGPSEFSRPGHIFPLIAKPGGVLERRGHTEAGVDLCRLAGKTPVAFIAELCNDDGTMMRLDNCAKFAQEHSLPLITVDAMVNYIRGQQGQVQPTLSAPPIEAPPVVKEKASEMESSPAVDSSGLRCSPCSVAESEHVKEDLQLEHLKQQQVTWPTAKPPAVPIGGDVEFVASTILPTITGRYTVCAYRNHVTKAEPLVLVIGDIKESTGLTLRVHDQCLTSEVFHSLRCDCKQQLDSALRYVNLAKCTQ